MRFRIIRQRHARHGGPDVDFPAKCYKQFVEYNIGPRRSVSRDVSGRASFHRLRQVSASLSLSPGGAKTKTLRLGTAVLVLPGTIRSCSPSRRQRSIFYPAGPSTSASARAIATRVRRLLRADRGGRCASQRSLDVS